MLLALYIQGVLYRIYIYIYIYMDIYKNIYNMYINIYFINHSFKPMRADFLEQGMYFSLFTMAGEQAENLEQY